MSARNEASFEERFRFFNGIAGDLELMCNYPRGTLHFSETELQKNNDGEMLNLISCRAYNYSDASAEAE